MPCYFRFAQAYCVQDSIYFILPSATPAAPPRYGGHLLSEGCASKAGLLSIRSCNSLRSLLAAPDVPPQPPRQSLGCNRGVWGEGAVGPGSPQSLTAKTDFRQRGPWRPPLPHEKRVGPRPTSFWMMALPIGFRVSGASGTEAPIKR